MFIKPLYFFDDNVGLKEPDQKNHYNYYYHINTFDWPTPHKHVDYWEFTILTHGKICNEINGCKEYYNEKTLFFATTSDSHFVKRCNNQKLRYITILVQESTIKSIINSISPYFLTTLLKGPRHCILPSELIYKIEKLIHRTSILPENAADQKNHLLCSAILLILQRLFVKSVDSLTPLTPFQEKLNSLSSKPETLTYTVSELCEALHYSKSHLNRLFKQELNTTPHDYLANLKFQFAENLLRISEYKIVEISRQVGFSSFAQFNNNFKQRFGMTPNEYRKKYKF